MCGRDDGQGEYLQSKYVNLYKLNGGLAYIGVSLLASTIVPIVKQEGASRKDQLEEWRRKRELLYVKHPILDLPPHLPMMT